MILFLHKLWYDTHSYVYCISFETISQPLKQNFFGKGGTFLKTVGIICEYNPFHLGHRKQILKIRQLCGADAAIVCLMSGNFVQRGMPAIFDKSLRAKAAIDCGADLVLELPVTYALSSAEGFAAGGVQILSPFCDSLCFGSETGDTDHLLKTAQALLSKDFPTFLREELDSGMSFPAARQAALSKMGQNSSLLEQPNDILAVEYCKAILSQGSNMTPLPILRQGSYHDTTVDPENPSATAVRSLIAGARDWKSCIPEAAHDTFTDAPIHTLEAGERAVLARLRTMSDDEFEALPYGSEGLWRKLMHNARSQATLEQVITATKSKRYTRTRLDRMVMCAFLGISDGMLNAPIPYIRVLGFSERGVTILKKARESGSFPHTGEKIADTYQTLEQRCDDLYGLFAVDHPSPAGLMEGRRIYFKK